MITVAAITALLLAASAGYANVVLTDITVTPNPIGVNDTATITINGYVNTPGPTEANCDTYILCVQPGQLTLDCDDPSISSTLGAWAWVMYPQHNFPLILGIPFRQIGSFEIRATTDWWGNGLNDCDRPDVFVRVEVLPDTIRSVQSITPAVVGQPTSLIVKGFGSCSQNVKIDWGDGSSSTTPGRGPVNLKVGTIASHTYTSIEQFRVTASGSVCNGTATTTIDVMPIAVPPGRVILPDDVARLRQKLDGFKHLPPPPPPSGGPGCQVCARLAQRITLLDQTGRDLQMQSDAIVKDLSIDGGKGVRADKVPIVGDLTKQLDEYFMLREQLLKRYKKALAKPGPRQKQLPPQPRS